MDSVKKKRKFLSSGETTCFIDVSRGKIEELRGQRKNLHVLKEMGTQLKENYGIILCVQEIRTRIHNLTKRFRNEKLAIGISGGSPSTWEYFNILNEFLGEFKINRLDELTEETTDDFHVDLQFRKPDDPFAQTSNAESPAGSSAASPGAGPTSSSIPGSSCSTITCSSSSRSSSWTSPENIPKKRKNKKEQIMNEELVQLAKDEHEIFKNFVQQSQKSDDERNALLKQNIELQQKFLEFLISNK